jgi:hypothetical protein
MNTSRYMNSQFIDNGDDSLEMSMLEELKEVKK